MLNMNANARILFLGFDYLMIISIAKFIKY